MRPATSSSRWSWSRSTRPGVTVVRSTAGLRLAGPARPLRDRLRQRPGARRQPARRGGLAASRSPRPGWARAASTTACARIGVRRAGAGPDGRPGATRGSRSASRWPSRAWCSSRLPSPATRSTRPGCCAKRRRGRSTSTATRAARNAGRADQGGGAADGVQRHRPRDPGARRGRASATTFPLARLYGWHRAMRHVRRARRGAHAHHRARRTRPREERFRRGGDAIVADRRELSGAWNFRDVADETGMLRPGRLFRSSELSGLDDGGPGRVAPAGHHRRRGPAVAA